MSVAKSTAPGALGEGGFRKLNPPYAATFVADMGFTNAAGKPMPGVSAFQKQDGKIVRVSASGFNDDDEFCPVWRFFDMLPEGPNDWRPKQTYA